MGKKAEQTKKMILEEASILFAEYGYQGITMKDICEKTGLSRGGLYRYYKSTRSVFGSIISSMAEKSKDLIDEDIINKCPAKALLKKMFHNLESEMLEPQKSLSLAIYEYSCKEDQSFFVKMNEDGRKRWRRVLDYGIETGEFNNVDVEAIIDLILYSYQGVRMWSRVISIEEDTSRNILGCLEDMLIKKGERL